MDILLSFLVGFFLYGVIEAINKNRKSQHLGKSQYVVNGGTITSMAGGKSSSIVNIKDSVLDKDKVLMKSKDSKVNKSRFATVDGVVKGATITSIAGGKSARYAKDDKNPQSRKESVMKSKTSRVGKSRFQGRRINP